MAIEKWGDWTVNVERGYLSEEAMEMLQKRLAKEEKAKKNGKASAKKSAKKPEKKDK